MVETFNVCPTAENLCFTRGDTFVWERVLKDTAGTVIDITGFSFVLSVDTEEDPPDNSTLIFALTGSVPVGTDGRVLFQISTANWASFVTAAGDPPATVYYDLQQTDGSSNTRTLRKGEFEVKQDVSK